MWLHNVINGCLFSETQIPNISCRFEVPSSLSAVVHAGWGDVETLGPLLLGGNIQPKSSLTPPSDLDGDTITAKHHERVQCIHNFLNGSFSKRIIVNICSQNYFYHVLFVPSQTPVKIATMVLLNMTWLSNRKTEADFLVCCWVAEVLLELREKTQLKAKM